MSERERERERESTRDREREPTRDRESTREREREPTRESTRERERESTREREIVDDTPVKRRIGRRLAFVCGTAALALGTLAFFLLAPIERATVEKVASEQIGLLAEAVAATYQVTTS